MKVIIIYNPNSTGDSKKNALVLAKELRALNVEVATKQTTHAGHGEGLAAEYAKSNTPIVLISSSGDGGYHEVINGALAAGKGKLVVGVLPSGNANDHFSELGGPSLATSIKKQKFQKIDTIKVTAKVEGRPWVRYAHSYIGIGVSANAAKKLTEDRPNALTEKWIVLHALFSFRYAKLQRNGETERYSSIIFGNISRMSKILKLSENSSVTDGKFEMNAIRFHSKLRLIVYLLTAATTGLKRSRSLRRWIFTTTHPLPIQLDGEVYTIDARSKVSIESIEQNLICVL
jgi:diacylglycerol kinase (ATP)